MIVQYLASTATGGRSLSRMEIEILPSPPPSFSSLSSWMQLCARAFQQKWICDFYDRDPIVLINGSAVHKFRPDISVSAGRWLIFRARHWFKLKPQLKRVATSRCHSRILANRSRGNLFHFISSKTKLQVNEHLRVQHLKSENLRPEGSRRVSFGFIRRIVLNLN